MNPTNQPVAWSGVLTALALNSMTLLRVFGVDITQDQSEAILGLLGSIIAVGALLLALRTVTTKKAENAVQTALVTQPSQTRTPEEQSKNILSGTPS